MGYLKLIFAFLLMACMPLKAADYYTWVDENGVTNYAERNPAGYQATFVTKRRRFGDRFGDRQPEATPADEEASDQPAAQGVDPASMIAEERAQLSAQIAETKRINCEIGKTNLAKLEAFSRIRVKGDDGQDRYLSPEEKAGKVADANKVIAENCSG
jgi:hypothetical protein